MRYRSSEEYREKLTALYCAQHSLGTAQEQKEYYLSTMAKRRLLGAQHEYAEFLGQTGRAKDAKEWHMAAGDPTSAETAQDIAEAFVKETAGQKLRVGIWKLANHKRRIKW